MEKRLEELVGEITEEDLVHSIIKRKKRTKWLRGIAALAACGNFLVQERTLLAALREYGRGITELFDGRFINEHLNLGAKSIVTGALVYYLLELFHIARYNLCRKGIAKVARMEQPIIYDRSVTGLEETNKEGVIALYKEELELVNDSINKCILATRVDLLEKRTDRAFRRYAQLLHAFEQQRYKGTTPEKVLGILTDIAYECTWASAKKTAKFKLHQAFHNLAIGNVKTAEIYFREACEKQDPLQVLINCLHGYFLDARKRIATEEIDLHDAKARYQWEKTIKLILADPSLQFQRVGESKNEVLEITGPELVRNTFIFKRTKDTQYLAREFARNQGLYAIYGHGDEVVDPLAFLQKDDFAYAVLRRVAGEPLAKTIDETTFLKAIEFVKNFHTRMNNPAATVWHKKMQLEVFDYRKCIREKYAARVPQQDEEAVAAATAFIADYLEKQPAYVIHGDCHPGNILQREGGFTLIDPEHMTLATRQTDIADLVESPLLKDKGIEEDKGIKLYDPSEQFMLTFSYSAIVKRLWHLGALEIFSYGKSPQEVAADKAHHKLHIMKNLERIVEMDGKQKDKAARLRDLVAA